MFKGIFILCVMMVFLSSCGNAGSSVAEFQTVSVNISKYSTGVLDTLGSDIYPGNVCSGTTETTITTGQTPETISLTLQSTAYNTVTNPLNVYVEYYTVTYEALNNGPAIPAYESTILGTVIPSGGTAELTNIPIVDVSRKDLLKASIAPCVSNTYTYRATVTIHMVEAQGSARKSQDLKFSTNIIFRDIPTATTA